jgi:purine/pyrimidine-nucleoside phosphorylase
MPIQHNTYFDGNVQSVASQRHGRKFSVGIIAMGSYFFGTDAAERMTVVSGLLRVRIQDTSEWVTYPAGTSFEVSAQSGFDVTAENDSAYQCEYL